LLRPNANDLRYAKRFMDETADEINERVARRLSDLLGDIHASAPGIFDPQQTADQLAQDFQRAVTVGGARSTP
jgi:hypothetical protein